MTKRIFSAILLVSAVTRSSNPEHSLDALYKEG